MSNVLLGFGDSWADGHELRYPEVKYLDILSQELDIPCLNFAKGSTSVPHLVLQLREFLDTKYDPSKKYTAIFFLTAQERTFFYNAENNIVHCSPQEAASDEKREPKIYYQLYTDQLGEFYLNTALLALQRLCAEYNIDDYYLPGWQEIRVWPEVKRVFPHPVTNLFNNGEYRPLLTMLHEKNKYIWPNQGHPNQQGHRVIAQALKAWIDVH